MFGEIRRQPSVTTLTLHGDLDLMTVERLRDLLAQAGDGTAHELVIDLNDAPFVDVLSLSAILAAADALGERGGRLTVRGASRPTRRVCALLNADDVLEPIVPPQRDRIAASN